MKMKQEHYDAIKEAVFAWMKNHPEWPAKYEYGDFPHANRVHDLNMRFRWDIYYAVIPSYWACDILYPYLNDEHIDTALRSMVPAITRRY